MRTRLLVLATGLMALQACASMGSLGNLGALDSAATVRAGPRPARGDPAPGNLRRRREAVDEGQQSESVRLAPRHAERDALPGGLARGGRRLSAGLAARRGRGSVIPIDISISFSDLPGLSGVGRRILARQPVPYRLEGTVGVDAGRLGQPVFGPMTLIRGEAAVPLRLDGPLSGSGSRRACARRRCAVAAVRVQAVADASSCTTLRRRPRPG